ncbi:hypothetical protein [Altererythrobacter sp. MF3-039]|uniref:hypothetical protein n=1 Tax=Altererythrobacter sp. MF3-039 TaxID=3252901 RepID=UPI00390C4B49
MPVSAAHAYIDAASVSMALQVIIGSVAAAFIAIRVYIHRFISLFRPERTDEAED